MGVDIERMRNIATNGIRAIDDDVRRMMLAAAKEIEEGQAREEMLRDDVDRWRALADANAKLAAACQRRSERAERLESNAM